MSREERGPIWVEGASPLTLEKQREDTGTPAAQAEDTPGTEAERAEARPAGVFKGKQLNWGLGFAMV